MTARRAGVPIVKDDCVVLDFVDATARHSLVSLASLFGMPKADLKGRKISEVIAQLAAAKKTNPYLDISRVEDADKIKAYAQQVDLFKVSYPPEIIQISSFKWHKMRENSYVVTLPPPREGMCVQRDLLGVWHAVGTIAGVFVHKKYNSLEPAIRKSDNQIEELCGNAITALMDLAQSCGCLHAGSISWCSRGLLAERCPPKSNKCWRRTRRADKKDRRVSHQGINPRVGQFGTRATSCPRLADRANRAVGCPRIRVVAVLGIGRR